VVHNIWRPGRRSFRAQSRMRCRSFARRAFWQAPKYRWIRINSRRRRPSPHRGAIYVDVDFFCATMLPGALATLGAFACAARNAGRRRLRQPAQGMPSCQRHLP
jgi:hypothetical protein